MTLRSCSNGWVSKSGRSVGSVFWAWSTTNYCVCWLQVAPRLCAKFEEQTQQRPTFNKISTRSSMNSAWWAIMMSLKRGFKASRWLSWDWDGLIGQYNRIIQFFFVLIPLYNRIQSKQNQGTHWDISKILSCNKPIGVSDAVPSHNINHGWILHIEC